jgi:hypothetical protein
VISIISVGMPDLETDAGHSIIGTWTRVRRLAGGYLLLTTLTPVRHISQILVHEFTYDFVIGYDADTFACRNR